MSRQTYDQTSSSLHQSSCYNNNYETNGQNMTGCSTGMTTSDNVYAPLNQSSSCPNSHESSSSIGISHSSNEYGYGYSTGTSDPTSRDFHMNQGCSTPTSSLQDSYGSSYPQSDSRYFDTTLSINYDNLYQNNTKLHPSTCYNTNNCSTEMTSFTRRYDANCGMTTNNDYLQGENYDCHFTTPSYIQSAPYETTQINKQEKESKEKNMSYVGMMASRKGIVAFGDSKGTREHFKDAHEDEIQIKKVFKSKKFLIVTYGTNEFFRNYSNRSNKGITLPLESLINNLLEDFNGTYKEFVPLLCEQLKETFQYFPFVKYQFIFGFYVDDFGKRTYGTDSCEITITGASFSNLLLNEHSTWRGFDDFAPKNPKPYELWTVEKMSKICREIVLSAIHLGDLCLDYNPVGGEVQIETLE